MDMIALNVDTAIGNLKSPVSTESAYVRFQNFTEKIVELIWINFNGDRERCMRLSTNQYVDVNTYAGHHWIAQVMNTRDLLLLDDNFVYTPKPWKKVVEEGNPNLKYPIIPPQMRTLIRIKLPVYTLRFRTLQVFRDILNKVEDVETLELPRNLIEEIKCIVTVKRRMLNME